jgi:hypothetical protein
VLDQNAQDLVLGVLREPQRYAAIVMAMRKYLAEKHSFAVRMRELVEIVNN